MTNRERWASIVSSVSVGRCAMSMVLLLQVLRRPPYDTERGGAGGTDIGPPVPPSYGPLQGPTASLRAVGSRGVLLGVELHDQLLLDRGVDHLAGRDAVHEDLQLRADDLQPRRHRALAGLRLGELEWQHLDGLGGHLDDV